MIGRRPYRRIQSSAGCRANHPTEPGNRIPWLKPPSPKGTHLVTTTVMDIWRMSNSASRGSPCVHPERRPEPVEAQAIGRIEGCNPAQGGIPNPAAAQGCWILPHAPPSEMTKLQRCDTISHENPSAWDVNGCARTGGSLDRREQLGQSNHA